MRLSDLIEILQIYRFERMTEHMVFFGPEFYFAERSAAQRATQLDLKRNYEIISEILKVLLRDAPNDLARQMERGDKQFRDWLEFNGSWSVSQNPLENAKNVRASAVLLEEILNVLDVASKEELILVPDTNSLLATADPTAYRAVAGQDAFEFMLLPTVLGELDRLKIDHRNLDVREKAKKVITRIKGWRNQGSLPTGVTVDKSILVKTSHSEPDMKRTLRWLDPNNEDDLIIASILAPQGAHPATHVILVSGDINIQNKAGEHVRRKIESSRKQIQYGASAGLPSVLLIYNNLDPVFQAFGTEHTDFIAAMYGDFTVLIDREARRSDWFNGRGQMLQENKNTSFSAVGHLAARLGSDRRRVFSKLSRL